MFRIACDSQQSARFGIPVDGMAVPLLILLEVETDRASAILRVKGDALSNAFTAIQTTKHSGAGRQVTDEGQDCLLSCQQITAIVQAHRFLIDLYRAFLYRDVR